MGNLTSIFRLIAFVAQLGSILTNLNDVTLYCFVILLLNISCLTMLLRNNILCRASGFGFLLILIPA